MTDAETESYSGGALGALRAKVLSLVFIANFFLTKLLIFFKFA